MTAQIPVAIARPRKTSEFRRAVSRALVNYSFLAPWLIGFLGLTLGPTLASLYLSFTDFDLLRDPRFIGLANYQRIATADTKFWHSMQVTFLYVILAVPLKLAFALALATVLDRGIAGLPIYRALFYLPSLLGASVAIAVLWRQLFAKDGLANAAARARRHPGPQLDLGSELRALHAGAPQRVAVRLANDHLPRRTAANSGGPLRGRQHRRCEQVRSSSSRSRCRC